MYHDFMATIYGRPNKNGSITYRIQIRRKYIPCFNLSFSSLEEAEKWVNLNEKKYIENYDEYIKWIERERLNLSRDRELN